MGQTISPQDALNRLLEGNRRFAAGNAPAELSPSRRSELASGQNPLAAVLCCADSRVGPEIVFNQTLGEIFVVRVAGNVVCDEVLGSLEYAVLRLATPLIFVMGHTDCGAVKAALMSERERRQLPGCLPVLIEHLVAAADHAREQQAEDLTLCCAQGNVAHQVHKLRRAQPVIAQAVQQGRVLVAGGVYSVATGEVTLFD